MSMNESVTEFSEVLLPLTSYSVRVWGIVVLVVVCSCGGTDSGT